MCNLSGGIEFLGGRASKKNMHKEGILYVITIMASRKCKYEISANNQILLLPTGLILSQLYPAIANYHRKLLYKSLHSERQLGTLFHADIFAFHDLCS